MTYDDEQIVRQLATVAEGMRNLEGTVRRLETDLAHERQNAQQSRARLYNRMDEMGKQHVRMEGAVSDVRQDVAALGVTVDGVKTVTDNVTRWQMMSLGVIATVGTFTAILGGVIATLWHRIWAALIGP